MLRPKMVLPSIILFLVVFSVAFSALVLPTSPPRVAIDWSRINEMDGDGAASFTSRGDIINVSLRVLCNVERGYNITFHANNAHQTNKSRLRRGSRGIIYGAMLITTGIKDANVVKSSLDLKNAGVTSVEVNFVGGVLPLNGSTQANNIRLRLKLSGYGSTPRLVPVGIYTDVITATAALN